MHKEIIKAINDQGWQITEEPLEMTHENGSIVKGEFAERILNDLDLPTIEIKWHHPVAHLWCTESSEKNPLDEYGGRYGRPGDLWVENGGWLGRREKDGFRVLVYDRLTPLDDSLWEEREVITPATPRKKLFDDFDDDIPF